jgi:hypothetical protein
VIGVRSHDESPLLCVRRLNLLALPPELLELVSQYETTLAERGAVKAEADKKAAEEKRKQTEAARTPSGPPSRRDGQGRARTSSKPATAKKTATSRPTVPAKPETPKPAPVALATLF